MCINSWHSSSKCNIFPLQRAGAIYSLTEVCLLKQYIWASHTLGSVPDYMYWHFRKTDTSTNRDWFLTQLFWHDKWRPLIRDRTLKIYIVYLSCMRGKVVMYLLKLYIWGAYQNVFWRVQYKHSSSANAYALPAQLKYIF